MNSDKAKEKKVDVHITRIVDCVKRLRRRIKRSERHSRYCFLLDNDGRKRKDAQRVKTVYHVESIMGYKQRESIEYNGIHSTNSGQQREYKEIHRESREAVMTRLCPLRPATRPT